MKKGVSLTLSTIVVAALVLIVLVILIAIMTGQTRLFRDSIGGKCQEGDDISCVQREKCDGIPINGVCDSGMVCCKTVSFGREGSK